MICTTNIIDNLDPSFDRRFLFKINFQKPIVSVKAQIWKLKLPRLSASECESLAADFNFSGGQIDNILRKSEIYEIVNGVTVDFNKIQDFCKEEILDNNHRNKIGFA